MAKKKLKIFKWIFFIGVLFIMFICFSQGMDKEMPPAETEYLKNVLSKITANSTKDDVINILGQPSRDLGLKVNWVVTIHGKKSRIGVYFSVTTGRATTINFDGGTGRFYFRKDLK